MDVSDRSLQAKLTQEAKITSACSLSEVIFAFGGFVSALNRFPRTDQMRGEAVFCAAQSSSSKL